MLKRWSPWRAAMWGTGLGVVAAVGALTSRAGGAAMSDAELAGQITGFVFTPILFAIGASIRNWAVGSSLAHETGPRGGIPDWLVILPGVLLGELHRVVLAALLAGMATIALVGRDVRANTTTFLIFDLLFQWLGMAIIFLAAVAVSHSRSPRTAHWLAVLSMVLGIGVRLAAGRYTTGDYPLWSLWYEIAFPLGSVFGWAIALWCVAGRSHARRV